MPHPKPPRPRLAFRVAVVGHRRDKFSRTADPAVANAIAGTLAMVEDAVLTHLSRNAALYRSELPRFTLYSPLAEGADRVGAQVALDRSGWELHAVLPFSAEKYRADFTREDSEPGSAQEFARLLEAASALTVVDGVPGRWDAYSQVGRTVVDAADLLIAVWDGLDPAGPGGTGSIVRNARRIDLPVVRIDSSPTAAAWLEDKSCEDEGRTTGLGALASRIDLLLAAPEDPLPALRYFAEKGGPRPVPRLYDRMVAMLTRIAGSRTGHRHGGPVPADPGGLAEAEWSAAFPELPGTMPEQVAERFAAQFGWADQLAGWYAAAFRASFSAVFLLAAASVAVGGILVLEPSESAGPGWIMLRMLEPILLGAMLWRVWSSRKSAWQERWLDYRALAERTRHLAILWLLARTPAILRVAPTPLASDPRLGWVAWLIRATSRQSGLVSGRLYGDYPDLARKLVIRTEAQQQRAFHANRRTATGAMDEPVSRLAERLVVLALVLSFLRLVGLPG
ncbi:MAG TPA: hypothetical protein PLL69_08535, partial [Gemmatimonadales bacterium]|nr:hypothetical protein [Gemmatimonadales bacterium]